MLCIRWALTKLSMACVHVYFANLSRPDTLDTVDGDDNSISGRRESTVRCVVIKSEITELDSPDDWWTLCLHDSGNFLSHDAESLNKYIDLISDLSVPCITIISSNIMWWMLIIFAWYENDWNTLKKTVTNTQLDYLAQLQDNSTTFIDRKWPNFLCVSLRVVSLLCDDNINSLFKGCRLLIFFFVRLSQVEY